MLDGTPSALTTRGSLHTMDSGYYAVSAGLAAQTQALEVVAHNLANLGTNGYRGEQTTFRSLLAGHDLSRAAAGGTNLLNAAVNNFGVLSGSRLDLTSGSIAPTGNPLDVEVAGSGFFVVQSAQGVGVLYTRDGSFHVTSTGQLVTSQGNAVLGEQGPVTLPNGAVAISSDGTISVSGSVVDRLRLAEFPPGTNLTAIGNSTYEAPAGSRSRRLQFEDLIYQNLIMPGAAATQQTTLVAGLQVGLGTRSAASEVIQLQGDFSQTGNPLDLTIQGQGFFQVLLPDGQTAYTRAGSFHLHRQGNLVTQDRHPLPPSITIPSGATSVTIGSDGTVSVTTAGQTAAQQVGTLQLALFNNPGGLNSTGSNLLLATTASGDPIIGPPGGSEGLGSVVQGMLEQSTVSGVGELVNMFGAHRPHEAP